ncbi:MAG: tetratricopeptide repeat protein, partial [Deltaproteobacteria bacterium]|nr:tetratricopeptide repeat protein [Deltaproteobacteria bacterium]
KFGNSVRVTTQLIDAGTGHHLWSEKYDRDMQDLFALQDEIAHKIIVELQVKLTEGEQARVSHKSTTNLEAWSYAVRGLKLFERASKENNAKAMEYFERAVELDPDYVWAWVRLAWTHVIAARSGNPSESIKKVVEISKKVLVLDESDSDVHALLGLVYLIQNQYELAIAEGEKSLVLGPTNAQAHVLLAVSMNAVGKFDDVIRLVKKAMRLHPYYPAYYLQWLGGAYRMVGRYEDALTAYNQLFDRSQKDEFPSLIAHLFLADLYAEFGKEDLARTHAEEVLRISPGFSLKEINKVSTYKYKDPAYLETRLNALRKAGFPDKPPLQLPDKPSIAVLAFDNLSSDPEQEYFSDGISENIITALSKVGELFVIARNSSFIYKEKPVKVQQIGRELGVRYVMEGSVQKSGNRVRITAQLIDTINGQHLWAENYDRDLKDIFEIQDEMTMKIVTALRIELTEGEQARVWAKQVKNLDVYLKAAQWKSARGEGTKEGVMRCGQLAKEIIEIEPDHPIGYRLLGWYYWQLAMRNISPRESTEKGFKLIQKALAMDESDELSHAVLGHINLIMRKYEKAIESGKRSVELLPNGAMVHALFGRTLCDAGQLDEGIASIKQGRRLNPFPDYWYYTYLGKCYSQNGQHEDALKEYQKALQRAPESPQIHGALAVTYILLGREEEARASAVKSMEFAPNVSVSLISKISTVKNQAFNELVADAMRKAGFPE